MLLLLYQLVRSGLVLKSGEGDFTGPVTTVLRENLSPDYDLVVLATKSYHMSDELCADLTKLHHNDCFFLPLLNGMRHMDGLDASLSKDAVLGGYCRVSMTIGEDGVLRHLGGGHEYVTGARTLAGQAMIERLKAFVGTTPVDF